MSCGKLISVEWCPHLRPRKHCTTGRLTLASLRLVLRTLHPAQNSARQCRLAVAPGRVSSCACSGASGFPTNWSNRNSARKSCSSKPIGRHVFLLLLSHLACKPACFCVEEPPGGSCACYAQRWRARQEKSAWLLRLLHCCSALAFVPIPPPHVFWAAGGPQLSPKRPRPLNH